MKHTFQTRMTIPPRERGEFQELLAEKDIADASWTNATTLVIHSSLPAAQIDEIVRQAADEYFLQAHFQRV